MRGPAPDRGELPLDLHLAAERAREMEDRLRIDSLAAALPETRSSPFRERSRRAAAPLRRALAPRGATGAVESPRMQARPPGDALRWTIAIAAPNDKLAARWGDWHFASAMARALDRRGHVGRVRTRAHETDPAIGDSDVCLVLRGLQPWRRRGRALHLLWIVSHPESVDPSECDEADLVLVASQRFADHLSRRTSTPVRVLLQATDHHRFRPLPPSERLSHRVAAVAKTRDVPRPIVMDAIAAGLRPAIYGSGWESFVDPSLVIAQYIPNEQLPSLYSSVGVLLNDHWSTMRDWGFVSNRVFDALACGTPVISDELPELTDLFGSAVPTYDGVDDLRRVVDEVLSSPRDDRARSDRRDLILGSHTFDDRAATILDLVAEMGLPARRNAARRGR